MEFLDQREKRESQVCWGHFQAQKENLVLQEPKETRETRACLASLAGKGQWEMLGRKDPLAWQDPQGHQDALVQSSRARKETEVHQVPEETQVSLVPPDLQGLP